MGNLAMAALCLCSTFGIFFTVNKEEKNPQEDRMFMISLAQLDTKPLILTVQNELCLALM